MTPDLLSAEEVGLLALLAVTWGLALVTYLPAVSIRVKARDRDEQ